MITIVALEDFDQNIVMPLCFLLLAITLWAGTRQPGNEARNNTTLITIIDG